MPFYIRARARYPLWLPPIVGAALIIVVAATRGFSGGIGTTLLHFLLLGLLGAGIAIGFYWGYNVSRIRRSLPLRWLLSSIAIAAYLSVFTLALSRSEGVVHWSRVGQSTYLTSTVLLSIVLGWVVGRDLFGLSPLTDRVYLTPAEYNALPDAERAQLRPDGSAETKA